MSIPNVSADLYIEKLGAELKKLYPDEQFLYEELDGIMQGIIGSLSWSALRCAQDQAQGEHIVRPVETLETIDHFCTTWMPREEILYRIENISGLPEEVVDRALKIVEGFTDHLVDENDQIFIEHIGSIYSPQTGLYNIELAAEMLIKPGSAKSATKILRSAGASGAM